MSVYLITGASYGVGEQLTRQALKKGHKVFGLARSEDKLKALKDDLGDGFEPLVCDVTDKKQVKELCDNLVELPDVVILNAGIGLFDNKKKFDLEVHENTYAVNYFGAMNFVEALFNRFVERGSGTFVAIASLAAYRATANSVAYASSKAALSTAFEGMRLTYGRLGLDFITVHPGFIDTQMTANNKFHMPFLYSAEKAAATILGGIEKGKLNINFPFPMWLAVTLARLLPACLYKKIVGLK